MSGLDKKQQDLLIEDPANPNPEKSLASYATGPSKSTLSHSTSAVQTRPSVKETIMAQKRAAKAAGKNLPERPGSAEPFGSSKKPAMQPISRPATAMSTSSRTISTASVGTLASAPVRPRRRADVPRPATADPYSSRKLMRTDTPPRSPAVSPVKGAKSPATTENSVKMNSKKIESPASTTPAKANSPKKIGPDKFGAQPSSSPTKAAENFTMVIPSIRSPNPYGLISSDSACSMTKFSPNVYEVEEPLLQAQLENGESPVSPPTPRPNGSLPLVNSNGIEKPRRSPVKTASDFGHLSVNGINSQRISMSPRAVAGRKEIMTLKNSYFEEQQPLRVYEDPAGDSNNGSPPPSRLRHTPRALEELPVNEPAKQHRQIFDHQLLAEEPISLDYHQKWLAIEAVERRHINTSESTQNPRLARQILESGIIRIQSRNLDVHGFRKLQTLIRTSGDSMWEDGYKFDELILPLLEYLETPNDEATPRSGKALDLKTQVLVTVRLLLQYQPMYFSTYYPRALTTVLIARKYYNSTSHIVCGLEETAESIVHQCVPEQCIDSVLDLLETERTEGVETNTIFMGLYVQAGLLHRLRDKGLPSPLSGEREERLGKMASRFLSDTNPDIRRAVIEFVLEFHDSMEPEKFWKLVGNAKEDHRSLITYYLARKRNIHQ